MISLLALALSAASSPSDARAVAWSRAGIVESASRRKMVFVDLASVAGPRDRLSALVLESFETDRDVGELAIVKEVEFACPRHAARVLSESVFEDGARVADQAVGGAWQPASADAANELALPVACGAVKGRATTADPLAEAARYFQDHPSRSSPFSMP